MTKLSNTAKWIIGSVSVIAVGTAGYIILRPKSSSSDSGSGDANTTPQTLGQTITSTIGSIAQGAGTGNAYKSNYVQERKDAKELVISMAAPRPKAGTIAANKRIQVSGMGKYNGTYKITHVWLDGSGNIGAVYVNSDKITEDSSRNETWKDTGTITILI